MNHDSLLIELRTEELPPHALLNMATSLAGFVTAALRELDFLAADSVSVHFATPRRLALAIGTVAERSPDRPMREKLVPVSIGRDATGAMSPALRKKLAGMNLAELELSDLEVAGEGKSESFYYSHVAPGRILSAVLQEVLPQAIDKLAGDKFMNYQLRDGSTVRFVRPARGLIALHGTRPLALTLLGLAANRSTEGHRFLSQGTIEIGHAQDYARTLHERGKVIVSFEERRAAILEGLLRKAGQEQLLAPAQLLDEVTALVEWPVVYEARFDEQFLEVPQECLILTMQQNQRYFALTNESARIINRFLLVSNIETATPQSIITGNERVLRARLADAKFFFDQDRKRTLESRLPALANVVYHNRLGSQADRVARIEAIAAKLADRLALDTGLARRAAQLAKADLVTDMVGEFPELQGIMGQYYARHDGEASAVAVAIEEHYRPRFAGDSLPASALGACLALADKVEALYGLFATGNAPTGDKDPYGLRRQSVGLLRILMHSSATSVPLAELIATAKTAFTSQGHLRTAKDLIDPGEQLLAFIYERLRSLLRENGYSADEIEALVSLAPQELDRVTPQLAAVRAFAALPEAQSLAAANKRIANILRKNEVQAGGVYNRTLLVEPAEKALAAALEAVLPQARQHFAAGDFTAMLLCLATLRDPVDSFFTDVMVMTDNEGLRANRIALLRQLYGLMNQFADLSKLAGRES